MQMTSGHMERKKRHLLRKDALTSEWAKRIRNIESVQKFDQICNSYTTIMTFLIDFIGISNVSQTNMYISWYLQWLNCTVNSSTFEKEIWMVVYLLLCNFGGVFGLCSFGWLYRQIKHATFVHTDISSHKYIFISCDRYRLNKIMKRLLSTYHPLDAKRLSF